MFYLQLLFSMFSHEDWEDFNDTTGRLFEFIPDIDPTITDKFADFRDL